MRPPSGEPPVRPVASRSCLPPCSWRPSPASCSPAPRWPTPSRPSPGRPRTPSGHRHALQDRVHPRAWGDRASSGGCSSTRSSASAPAAACALRRSAATLRWSWAGRSAPACSSIAVAVVTLFFLPEIRDPRRSGPDGAGGGAAGRTRPSTSPHRRGARTKPSRSRCPAQQYLWRYQYPNGAVSFHDMVVPKDTTVTARDHLERRRAQLVDSRARREVRRHPGLTNETWFKATRTGRFEGQCAEFCGANHAFMTARVIVVEPDAYQRWVRRPEAPDRRGAASLGRSSASSSSGRRGRLAPAERMATPEYAAGTLTPQTPEISIRGLPAAPCDLDRLGHDHRPQEDRDPLLLHDRSSSSWSAGSRRC